MYTFDDIAKTFVNFHGADPEHFNEGSRGGRIDLENGLRVSIQQRFTQKSIGSHAEPPSAEHPAGTFELAILPRHSADPSAEFLSQALGTAVHDSVIGHLTPDEVVTVVNNAARLAL